MDGNLRELLELAVGEPPRLMSLEAVHRRAIRRRMAQLGAVGLATALVAGLGASLAAAALPASPSDTSRSTKTSGPPRYYLQQYYDTRTNSEALVVRARTTGRITAAIGDPRPGAQCGGGGNFAFAAADNDEFYLICVIWHEKPGPRGKITFLESFIYNLHITAAGRVGDFSQVKGGVFKGLWGDNIAVAPNGSQVAVEVIRPGPSGVIYTNSVPEGIFVINTRTGVRALWHTGPYRPGTRQFANGRDISFTRDGGEIVVAENRCGRGRYQSTGTCSGLQVWAYGPAGRGGSLETGQVLLTKAALKPAGTSLFGALISPDGAAVTAALMTCPRHRTCGLSVARISVSSGKVVRVLYRAFGTASQDFLSSFFSSDPTGRYFILAGGAGKAQVNGWINRGHLVPLPPVDGPSLQYEAW